MLNRKNRMILPPLTLPYTSLSRLRLDTSITLSYYSLNGYFQYPFTISSTFYLTFFFLYNYPLFLLSNNIKHQVKKRGNILLYHWHQSISSVSVERYSKGGVVGSGIKALNSQILSKSSIKLFENSSVRGTKAIESNDSVAFFFYH